MSVLFAGIDGTETPNVGYGGLLGGGGLGAALGSSVYCGQVLVLLCCAFLGRRRIN